VRRALAIGVVAWAAYAAPAGAHATLQATEPARAGAVEPAPAEVVLRFDEPVEVAFGAVRVFDARGREVQEGKPFPRGSRDVAVKLRDDLPRGAYTAIYRVVSADSHPVSGGFTFTVGDEPVAAGASVADLLGDQRAGPVTSVAFGAARALQYAAIALGLGVLAVTLLVWSGAATRRIVLVAGVAGVLSALAALPLQAATASGEPVRAALGSIGEVLGTRFGVVWGAGALVWLMVLALRSAWPVLPLALLPGLGGHAGVDGVVLAANVAHVLAAGAWIGGIAVLVVARPPRGVLPRFSTVALVSVAVLLAGGILQAILELDAAGDLLDTAYGRAILVKAALICGLLVLGARNRRRTTTGRLRAEVVLGVAALAVTGALAGYSPVRASRPYSASKDLGPARAQLTVEPGTIHVYLFRRSDGSHYDAPEELRFEASLPDRGVAPIEIAARKAGPGHYVAATALSPPGEWRLQLIARIGDFDELRTTFTVPVQ
jgi:copper transport protein